MRDSAHGRRLRRRVMVAVLAGTLLGTTVACGSDHPAKKTTTVAASTSASPTPTPPPAPVLWPLTGVVSGPVPARPAVAVKIENSVDARPQTGLNSADLVWEEVVEGGITRYLAVFHSHLPPVIGPVRSVRPMDPAIAAPLRGLFAFSGGQKPFVAAVAASGLQVISNDAGNAGFHRVGYRPAPHNVYGDLQAYLRQANAGHKAAPSPQFLFAGADQKPTAYTAGTSTPSLSLTMSGSGHPRWTWSPSTGAWLRAENGTPATGADGKQFAAKNVVVLRVDVVNTSYVDPAHNPVPETKLIGSGQALVASGGRRVAATWSKPSVGARLTLTGANGAPVLLDPGSTWIELVPNGTGAVVPG